MRLSGRHKMCIFGKKWYSIEVCETSRVLPNKPYCPKTIIQKFAKANIPTMVCNAHVAPAEPVTVNVCTASGLLPNSWCPEIEERSFAPGDEPTAICTIHHEPTVWRYICEQTGKLVNPYCPNQIHKEFPQSQAPTVVCDLHLKPIPKCPNPYYKTGKLQIYSAFELSWAGMKSTIACPDSQRGKFLDALVADGVNAIRDALTCAHDPDDPLDYYQLEDDDFLPVLISRVKEVAERDLTWILLLEPYGRGISDNQARFYIRALMPFIQNLIWEPINEPRNNDRQRQLVKILLDEGIPKNHISIEYADAGDWFTMFDDYDLKGKALVSSHWMGSVESLEYIFGGSTAQTVLKWGNFWGSCDGPDTMLKSTGRNFWWCIQHGWDNRRPTAQQVREIVAWFKENGAIGYEMLTAILYPDSGAPTIAGAFSNEGREERWALAGA